MMKPPLGACVSEWGGGVVVLAISSLSKCSDQVSTTQGTVVMKQPLGACVSLSEWGVSVSHCIAFQIHGSTTQGTVVMKPPLGACISEWGVSVSHCIAFQIHSSTTQGTAVMKHPLCACVSEWQAGDEDVPATSRLHGGPRAVGLRAYRRGSLNSLHHHKPLTTHILVHIMYNAINKQQQQSTAVTV